MFLMLPRGVLPDARTRDAIAEWSQRPFENWTLLGEGFRRSVRDSFCRARVALCSKHWPSMHALMPTQAPEALNEATVGTYVARLREAAEHDARPTALLYEMSADVHSQSGYFILDGHHKIEALRRLSRERDAALRPPPRINFLIVSKPAPTRDGEHHRTYLDELSGIQQLQRQRECERTAPFSVEEVIAASKHTAALRALYEASQVVGVIGHLMSGVEVRARQEAREAEVATCRQEARARAEAGTLKKALQAARVPGLNLGAHSRAIKGAAAQEERDYWDALCREHSVGPPAPVAAECSEQVEEDTEADGFDLSGWLFDD